MAIDLLNSFLQKGQNVSTNSKSSSTGSVVSMPQNLQVMRAIRSLQAGQTLRGEIISVKGEEVQLAILKDVIIDAKLAQSMNLSVGTSMPFQVKSNNQNGLSLIPLFTNTAADPNVLKALEMAQLPMNDRSIEMVQTLMERGMPIDKQSLQDTYRDVSSLKDFEVQNIISLRQLQIPVKAENLNQLSAYENNQHYLSDTFSEVGDVVGKYIVELIKEGKTPEAKNLVQQLQQVFWPQEEGAKVQVNNTEVKSMIITEELLPQEKIQEQLVGSEEQELAKDAAILIKSEAGHPIPKEGEDGVKFQSMVPKEGEDGMKSPILVKEQTAPSWEDLLRELNTPKESSKITKLFEKIWNKEVSEQWLMDTETLFDKKQVKEYYEKLDLGIKRLENIIGETADAKSPVAKVVQNVSSNLDFMNQLNQMHAYIQLPLKMANKNAQGELYVFTNKKNLTKQEGKVTALLHLDMEHLGKMDVYVALENKKVSTNFYLEKEEYLDFLEENMELLNSRLQKRGYECTIKTSLRQETEESVMKVIEKQQGQSVLLSTQAFDVRA